MGNGMLRLKVQSTRDFKHLAFSQVLVSSWLSAFVLKRALHQRMPCVTCTTSAWASPCKTTQPDHKWTVLRSACVLQSTQWVKTMHTKNRKNRMPNHACIEFAENMTPPAPLAAVMFVEPCGQPLVGFTLQPECHTAENMCWLDLWNNRRVSSVRSVQWATRGRLQTEVRSRPANRASATTTKPHRVIRRQACARVFTSPRVITAKAAFRVVLDFQNKEHHVSWHPSARA